MNYACIYVLAFNNGVTKEDLKELILHSSLYAGLPAANAAMHMAEEVFKELGIEVNSVAAKRTGLRR